MKEFNPFKMAQAQFDLVAEKLNLDDGIREYLRVPEKELKFSIPVKLESGETKVLEGFRIQHSTARGPAKGGIRFHPNETMDTVRALSMWMTWKSAVVNIPLGGSKGGVICNPREFSNLELEQISRKYVKRIAYFSGPNLDVPAPDVMTNPQMMSWMMDEYNSIHHGHFPGFITGKPVQVGGSLGRTEATGYGVIYMVREALKALGLDISSAKASVQGFGNVAHYAIKLFNQYGGKVIAVSCWDQKEKKPFVLINDNGVDLDFLMSITDMYGTIDRSKLTKDYVVDWNENAWLEQEVDVLIPAAIENVIREDNVNKINFKTVKIIAEGANGPTRPEADKVIKEKGVLIIPDFLCNSGGVTCSYFEQVQSNTNYYWPKKEVLEKLDEKLTTAFHNVYNLAKEKKEYMRDAAYMIAIDNVAKTVKLRGIVY